MKESGKRLHVYVLADDWESFNTFVKEDGFVELNCTFIRHPVAIDTKDKKYIEVWDIRSCASMLEEIEQEIEEKGGVFTYNRA